MANWKPKGGEVEIEFDQDEERRYEDPRRGERSVLERIAWPEKLRR